MWTSAPPSSSAVTISPVAALTSGGPPRKIVPCSLTMIDSSRHRRHVRAARRARSHDDGDLRNALRRHRRLVVEDAAEMVAVGEHIGLVRQVRAARIDEVDARQPVLARDLLRAQVLLDGHRVIRAALDRRVVADDHAFAARNAADAGDDAGARRWCRRTCRARRAARARGTGCRDRAARARARAAGACRARRASRGLRRRRPARPPRPALAQVGDQRRHRVAIRRERRVAGIELRFETWHRCRACRRGSVSRERRETRGEQHEQRSRRAGAASAARAAHARKRPPARLASQATGRLTNRLLKLNSAAERHERERLVAAHRGDELRQEREEEQRDLRIEHVDHERFAEDRDRGGVARARRSGARTQPFRCAPSRATGSHISDEAHAGVEQVSGAAPLDDVERRRGGREQHGQAERPRRACARRSPR